MAAALAEAPPPASRTARKGSQRRYKQVSEQLGNTPAVCKASYVDPRVVDRFENGETVAHVLPARPTRRMQTGTPRRCSSPPCASCCLRETRRAPPDSGGALLVERSS